jgi:hypothetical protein
VIPIARPPTHYVYLVKSVYICSKKGVYVGLNGSRSRCDAQRESGQNGYVNSYRILKTKERREWMWAKAVSPRMSWVPKPGLSSHEPIPRLSVSWLHFSPGPLGRSIPCLFRSRPAYREFASASALVFCVCFGLGPLGQPIASLHRPRPSYFGLGLASSASRPS